MADEQTPAFDEFAKGIWRDNPFFVQMLGTCPTLAVTNSAVNALAMGVMTAFVLVASSVLVSIVRNFIPAQVRISAYIVIIATFVTVADFLLQATAPAVHKDLGAFISLIVVNCIILGRAEAFAGKNPPWRAALDAAGMGIGFTIALLSLGIPRELLGGGSLFGYSLFGPSFEPWVIMILPPGGFLVAGLLMLGLAVLAERRAARAKVAT